MGVPIHSTTTCSVLRIVLLQSDLFRFSLLPFSLAYLLSYSLLLNTSVQTVAVR
uniref:Uncharacterized protein n=1 Tax=Anopheles funestus TaxID=62324 RepID=A0A4Y0BGQ0_ANOFN